MEFEKKVCPDCNGSGVYQEYDEYDRYTVHPCATCDGSGEIERQSVTSEEVQRAIDILIDWDNENFEDRSVGIYIDSDMKFAVPLAITALQAYQPKGE